MGEFITTNKPGTTEEKMCTSRQSPHQQQAEDIQWEGLYQGLYPDLSGLFGSEVREEGREGQERQSTSMRILLRLLGISPDQAAPTPSAPAGEGEQHQCHCNNHQPDLLPIILSRCCRFSMRMTKHLVGVGSPLMMLLAIFLMPRSIIYSAVFMMLSAGLGLHMPTLVVGQILYGLISLTDPLLITLICVWAVHKTAIKKKPLIDLNYWKRRIAGMERNRMD